jgi:glucose/arabinose dehydrogenase
MWRHIRNLSIILILLAAGAYYWASRPDVARLSMDQVTGTKPVIGEPRIQHFPTIGIANNVGWKKGEAPLAAPGLKVTLYAEGLNHPRNLFTLPNGDILVAETTGPTSKGGGLRAMVESWLMKKAGAGGKSANRITLLRDADSDGVPELKKTFLTGLNSPFGIAMIGDYLYVADYGAVFAYPFKVGDTELTGKASRVKNLNSDGPVGHWTRNLVASPDGKGLFVAVGSSSNIADGGIAKERGRAMIIRIDVTTRKAAPWSVGLRNPVGLAFDKQGKLWTTVNERDMMGSDMVPDYLAWAEEASDYGWPQHYWGGYTDSRVSPKLDDKRQYEKRPEFSLGPHVAALGLVFADKAKLGSSFADGAFIARHGSWNRIPPAGYDVVFVKFENGMPVGKPVPVLTGFIGQDGNTHGRPAMLAVDKTGALLVSDDSGNRIWRVTAG